MRRTSRKPSPAPSNTNGASSDVGAQRRRADETEPDAERQLEQVDDEEQPGTGAEELEHAQAGHQEVDGRHRAGGIGDHGDEARADAHRCRGNLLYARPADGIGIGAPSTGPAMPTDQLHCDEHEQHEPDRASHDAVVNACDEHNSQQDTDGQPREQPGEQAPVGMTPVGNHREHVADHQQRQQRPGGLARRQLAGEDDDGESRQPADRRLGEPDDQRSEREEQPGRQAEISHQCALA